MELQPFIWHHVGDFLSLTQVECLKCAQHVLQDENQLKETRFWGKITGIENDYFIICGTEQGGSKTKYFYSMDLISWTMLPRKKSTACKLTEICHYLFSGVPSNIVEVHTVLDEDWQVVTHKLKEEDRLVATINRINSESSLRGDISQEAWQQVKCGSQTAQLQSLIWPGLVIIPRSLNTNSMQLYIGDGRKNQDLYFMLPG